MATKGMTECYRLGLLIGFFKPARVAAWIDAELGVPEDAVPLAERLARGDSLSDVVHAAADRLEAAPGDVSGMAPVRALLGLMANKLAQDRSLGPKTTNMMSHLTLLASMPEEKAVEIATFDEQFDLPGADQEALTEELLAFLRAYEPYADDFTPADDL